MLKPFREYYAGLGSCVLYHRIAAEKIQYNEHSPYSVLSVSKENFAAQVRELSKHFNVTSLPECVEALRAGSLGPKTLVLTFDDGYKDNLINALPILEEYNIPATIYIATGLIDRTAELWWFEQEFIVRNCSSFKFQWEDWNCKWNLVSPEEKYIAIQSLNDMFKSFSLEKQQSFMEVLRLQYDQTYSYDEEMLTWDQVRLLDQHPLITIGAHTVNHPVLTNLEPEALLSELKVSKQRLEEELGHPILHFAYPFGGRPEVGEREFAAACECDFASAVTTRSGNLYHEHRNFLYSLPRIPVNYEDTLEDITWKLSGINSAFRKHSRRVQPA